MAEIETRTMSKVAWRLVPFLMLCYFIAYLDRVNIGFAGRVDVEGPRPFRRRLRRRGGHILHRLFLLRGAQQHGARPLRRPHLDRAHHADLGPDRRRAGLRDRRIQPETRAVAARRRRGRLLPRHHLFPDALVPLGLPRPHRRPVHVRDPDLDRDRLADLGADPQPGRVRGPSRLAMDVPARGAARAADVARGAVLPHRPPAPRDLAHDRGEPMVAEAVSTPSARRASAKARRRGSSRCSTRG